MARKTFQSFYIRLFTFSDNCWRVPGDGTGGLGGVSEGGGRLFVRGCGRHPWHFSFGPLNLHRRSFRGSVRPHSRTPGHPGPQLARGFRRQNQKSHPQTPHQGHTSSLHHHTNPPRHWVGYLRQILFRDAKPGLLLHSISTMH